jgi:hypothetical protein
MNDPQTAEKTELRVTLRLETQASGAPLAATAKPIVASIIEFPECRVEAATRTAAIEKVQAALLERLANVELIPWDVPLTVVQSNGSQSIEAFKDNSVFEDIMSRIQSERDAYGEEEMEASEYVR